MKSFLYILQINSWEDQVIFLCKYMLISDYHLKLPQKTAKQKVLFCGRSTQTTSRQTRQVITRNIQHVNTVHLKELEDYQDLFSGLGKVEEKCHLYLRENYSPVCNSTPWWVPIPLLQKGKEQLETLVKEGIISQIKEPTEWCSHMVLIEKSDESIQICGGFVKLNQNPEERISPYFRNGCWILSWETPKSFQS